MITYIPDADVYWPKKDEVNFPDTIALPLWPEGTGAFKWFFLSPFKRRESIFNVDYITYIPSLGKYCLIRKNFVYDGASVPQTVPGCSPDGPLYYGSGPHDHLYRFGGLYLSDGPDQPFIFTEFTHFESDKIFTSLNNKANNLPRSNDIVEKILNVAGLITYRPRDISQVDWTKPVYST